MSRLFGMTSIQKLGPTVEEVAEQLEGLAPIPKMTFSACKTEAFMNVLQSSQRQKILIAGIETHICVYQTDVGLKNRTMRYKSLKMPYLPARWQINNMDLRR